MQKFKEKHGYKFKVKKSQTEKSLGKKLSLLKKFRSTFNTKEIPNVLFTPLRQEYSDLAWKKLTQSEIEYH